MNTQDDYTDMMQNGARKDETSSLKTTTADWNRRDFMQRAAIASGSLGLFPAISYSDVASANQSSGYRYDSRRTFDELDERWHESGGWKNETNDSTSSGRSGKLGWGVSYMMQAYLYMYQAYGDTYYLALLLGFNR